MPVEGRARAILSRACRHSASPLMKGSCICSSICAVGCSAQGTGAKQAGDRLRRAVGIAQSLSSVRRDRDRRRSGPGTACSAASRRRISRSSPPRRRGSACRADCRSGHGRRRRHARSWDAASDKLSNSVAAALATIIPGQIAAKLGDRAPAIKRLRASGAASSHSAGRGGGPCGGGGR